MSKSEKYNPKTIVAVKQLKKLDAFMYELPEIKKSLDQAFEGGAIGVFALDCIVAEPHATSLGVGKIPVTDTEAVVGMSPLKYQTEGLNYVISTLCEAGLHVSFWCFLGDDDFQYSVSPEYQIKVPHIRQAIEQQIQVIGDELKTTTKRFQCATSVFGWLIQEQQNQDLLPVRKEIRQAIQLGVEQEALSLKILKRFRGMVGWRKQLLDSSGLTLTAEMEQIITSQSEEELTSFAFQGYAASEVIGRENPDTPIIFMNTYPDMGTQNLDDECMRIVGLLGILSAKYGTIHLPGAERAAKVIGEIERAESKDFAVFRCGNPKGSPTAIGYGKKIRPNI